MPHSFPHLLNEVGALLGGNARGQPQHRGELQALAHGGERVVHVALLAVGREPRKRLVLLGEAVEEDGALLQGEEREKEGREIAPGGLEIREEGGCMRELD